MHLSVGEVLNTEDFKFPVFLLDGYDDESIVWESGPGSGLGRYEPWVAVTDYGPR
jgi:hypothetical protein